LTKLGIGMGSGDILEVVKFGIGLIPDVHCVGTFIDG